MGKAPVRLAARAHNHIVYADCSQATATSPSPSPQPGHGGCKEDVRTNLALSPLLFHHPDLLPPLRPAGSLARPSSHFDRIYSAIDPFFPHYPPDAGLAC